MYRFMFSNWESGNNEVVPIMLDNNVQAICYVSVKHGYFLIIPYPFF